MQEIRNRSTTVFATNFFVASKCQDHGSFRFKSSLDQQIQTLDDRNQIALVIGSASTANNFAIVISFVRWMSPILHRISKYWYYILMGKHENWLCFLCWNTAFPGQD